ncbi:L-threonine ammonia-lyase-like isoform X2 [Periplaneta americana]
MRTPCTKSRLGERLRVRELYFKKEFLQYTGNFKERGAAHVLHKLKRGVPAVRGAVSASAGNHAAAMAYHGRREGVPVVVVMPVGAPRVKVQSCEEFGATVLLHGANMADAKRRGLRYARDEGMVYVNGFDHPDVLAGAASVAKEALEDVPQLDAFVVPVGGGGLLAGVCVVAKAAGKMVIGVESDTCAGFSAALAAGRPAPAPVAPSVADGLAVPVVGYNAFATAAPLVDRVAVVEERWLAQAMLDLLEAEKAVVEGAGASGLALLKSGRLGALLADKVVCVVLTGGNVDTAVLGRCVDRALAAAGRLLHFTVRLEDRPGALPELLGALGELGANVVRMTQTRPWIQMQLWEVDVTLVVEVVGRAAADVLTRSLEERYGARFRLEPIPE